VIYSVSLCTREGVAQESRIPKRRITMAEKSPFEVTVGGKPLSPEAKKKVHDALVKTLQDQLGKEGHTLTGPGRPGISVSGHESGSGHGSTDTAKDTAKLE
jgi:hypothetical protein